MPPEDPNKAEELLQHYAERRRGQGGDFSLHPATRRLLHGEVARQHGSSAGRKTSLLSWFGTWRSRVTLGVAVGAAIIIVTLLTWNPAPTEQPMRMAKNEPVGDLQSELRSQGAAERKLAEEEKEVGMLAASPALNESVEGVRSKAKSLASLEDPTASLSPVRNLPAANAPVDYYFDYSAFSSTNVLAFDMAGASSRNLWTAPPASTQLPLGFYSLDGALADQRGFSPTGPQMGVTMELKENLGSRLNGSETSGVMLADTARYAKDSPTPSLPTPEIPSPDAKRFAEVAQVQLRSEVKNQTDGFGVSLSRAGAEDNVARNRQLNFTRPGPAVETAAKPTSNPEAPALEVASASAPAQPRAAIAGTAITKTLGDSSAIDSRADFDGAPTVFYRQSNPAEISQVAEKIDSLQKKTEATPTVLNRFTIEQKGETLRLLETDGSVYEGTIDSGLVTAAEDSKLDGARDKSESLRESRAGAKMSNVNARLYSFRAAGSNITLRQNVVVNGQLSAGEDLATRLGRRAGGTSEMVAGGAASASAVTRSRLPERPAAQPSSQSTATPGVGGRGAATGITNLISAIEGTVRVGLTNEQRFRAVQAPR